MRFFLETWFFFIINMTIQKIFLGDFFSSKYYYL